MGPDHKPVLQLDLWFGKISETQSQTFFQKGVLTPNELDAICLVLPMSCEVLTGRVEITINNGSVEKDFKIPSQKTFINFATSMMTNGHFVPFSLSTKH